MDHDPHGEKHSSHVKWHSLPNDSLNQEKHAVPKG